MPVACPDREALTAWSLGYLDEIRREQIAGHVSSCDSCLSALDALELPTDRIVEQLRRPADPASTSEAFGERTPDTQWHPPPATAAAELAPGTMVGPYEVIEEVRRGGMGAVYRARHTRLDRVVALKVLAPDRFRDPRAVARFYREMQSAGAIDHPNVVRVSDAGEAGGVPYLAMEYIDGTDLDRLIRQRGPLRVPVACKIVRRVALALEHVRQKGLVHRDVKPSNIMMTREGRVRLLDLGLALLRDGRADGAEITDSGILLGTAAYMAPEQASDPHGVDIRADLYSLGCTLYFLLAGRPPFGGKEDGSPLKTLMAHAHEPAPSIQAVRPEVPDPLAAVLVRLMAKDPADRFQAPGEAAAALEPFCEDGPAASVRAEPEPIAEPPAPAAAAGGSARRLRPRTAVAALVPILGLLMAWPIIDLMRAPHGKEADASASEPMSPVALVQRPAAIPGVQSWTIETRRRRTVAPWNAVAYDRKGRWVALGSGDGVVRLFDAREGRLIRALVGHGAGVRALAVHPSRPILASASGSGHSTVRIWDTETWQLIDDFRGFPGGVNGLAWSPDGENLALGGLEGLRLWNIKTGIGTPLDAASISMALAWSPDGRTLAFDIGTTGPCLFDVKQRQTRKFPAEYGTRALAWSPDGRTLAVCRQGKVLMVDTTTGEQVAAIERPSDWQAAVAFSPGGDAIALSDGMVVWDARTRRERLPRPPQWFRMADSLSWSPDGKALAMVGGGSVEAAIYDTATGHPILKFDSYHQSSPIRTASWSTDGSMLVWEGPTWGFEAWDSASYRPLGGIAIDGPYPSLSPDGKLVATFEKGTLHVIDFRSKGEVRRIRTTGADDRYAAWSPDGRTVVVPRERAIELFDLESEAVSRTFDFPPAADHIVAWSPDGRVLAAGTRPILLFDVATGRTRILGDKEKVQSTSRPALRWSPDGRRLACGYEAEVRVWDAAKDRLLFRRLAHAGSVRQLAWATDGGTLFTGGVDELGVDEVKTWDVPTGKLLGTRRGVGHVLSPDGKRVADFEPCSIRLYDLATGRPEGAVVIMPAPKALAISPEGHYRGSPGIEDEIVYVVETDTGRQETLTPAEFSARYRWTNDPSRVGIAR
jgi:WD40 repeat protein/tRNA A-37 threonylcarbamoyl transferase component Bud32